MAQGKAYAQDKILESLRPYLELGFSRSKACKLIGLDETTLSKGAKSSEEVSMKLTGWENTMNALAMANIQMAIKKESESEEDVRKENSWKWLQTKEETMRPKQDITTDGKELPTPIINVPVNNSYTESYSDDEENPSGTGGN